MRIALIGYTGFVGSNLHRQFVVSKAYNSTNIHTIAGEHFDLCLCAGVRAQRWLANTNPTQDLADIHQLIKHLAQATFDRFILISTVDVYLTTFDVDENTPIDDLTNHAYGHNRRVLERWVEQTYPKHHIVRLPGLFGQGLKKNFIYDLMHPTPMLFNQNVMDDLRQRLTSSEFAMIEAAYPKQGQNYVHDGTHAPDIQTILDRYGISSLMFTDDRDQFQYYNLENLANDLSVVMQREVKVINLVSEPIQARELYEALMGKPYQNQLQRAPQHYDVQTVHAHHFGSNGYYLRSKQAVIEEIRTFMERLPA
jgi:nucleoside-diphosphate-sugar epimerase